MMNRKYLRLTKLHVQNIKSTIYQQNKEVHVTKKIVYLLPTKDGLINTINSISMIKHMLKNNIKV